MRCAFCRAAAQHAYSGTPTCARCGDVLLATARAIIAERDVAREERDDAVRDLKAAAPSPSPADRPRVLLFLNPGDGGTVAQHHTTGATTVTKTTEAPKYTTPIEQHVGEDDDLVRVVLREICTDYADYGEEAWEDLSPGDRAWWYAVLEDLHDAEVEHAELDADHRRRVDEYLEGAETGDLEFHAACLRAAIEATRTRSD